METIVISLGGSVLAPGKIDVKFLSDFRKLIMKHKDKQFAIICGGGRTARDYMEAAGAVTKLTSNDLDWIGIHATRLNAQLLRNVFRDVAMKHVIKNPTLPIDTKEKVIIAGGWKPGRSTDHIAVLLAKNLGAKKVINITNTDHVYTKDPRKFKDAKPLDSLTWKEFKSIVGTTRWSPGLSAPFDPVAAQEAQSSKISVAIVGKNLKNLDLVIQGLKFNGTFIY